MTSSLAQVRALFALRWRMIRNDTVQVIVILSMVVVVWLVAITALGARHLDGPELVTAIRVAPQAFFGFAFLAIIAPLTAGGGSEVIPSSQLVAYPLKPRAAFLGGLALAPLNLVWIIQILGLVAETTIVSHRPWHGALTAALYVGAITATGQAFAWWVIGMRQTAAGRRAVAVSGGGLAVGVLLLLRSQYRQTALDHLPTEVLVRALRFSDQGLWSLWGGVTLSLLGMLLVALALGERTCAWALRRPGDAGAIRSTRAHRRRLQERSPLRTLVAIDRGSVWRAPALRRGAVVLALLPGLAAAGAQVPWSSLVVLPGLVAAGAGLLFGVNAFCLDGSGAVLLASMPHDPRLVLRSKTIVLTETVLAGAVLAALSGSLRAPGSPTASDLAGILASILASSAVVVAAGLSGSVRRPHKAELNGPRDAVAPPGALTAASVRLAVPAGLVGMTMGFVVRSGVWWVAPALAVVVLGVAALSLIRTARLWDDPLQRSRVVQVVSAG
jgi:hypothetical protein